MRAVIVTGSAGGIGQALIEAFNSEGYFTIGLDHRPTLNAGADLVVDLEAIANLPQAGDSLYEEIERALKGHELHALINNAAVQILGPSEELLLSGFRSSLDVNVTAAFRLTQLCLNLLERTNGTVVNIGSIHSRLTKGGFVAYATSKAALEGMGRAMAVEYGNRLRVNTIRPAAIATDMLKDGFTENQSRLIELAHFHPVERIGEPTEVARLAVFLCGKDARFISGACIDIDGAIGARLHDPS